MEKRLLFIVDGNGMYENGQHTQKSTVNGTFYTELVDSLFKYDVVLYQMNLPYITEDKEIEAAILTDPFLSIVPDELKSKIIIIKHGVGTPPEWNTEAIKIQDYYASEGYSFIICGLYTNWSVKAVYDTLTDRLAKYGIDITINYYLSRRSSTNANNKGLDTRPSRKRR